MFFKYTYGKIIIKTKYLTTIRNIYKFAILYDKIILGYNMMSVYFTIILSLINFQYFKIKSLII